MTIVEYWHLSWSACVVEIPAPHQQNAWNGVAMGEWGEERGSGEWGERGGRGGRGLPGFLAGHKHKQTAGRMETIKFLISQLEPLVFCL